MASYALTKPFSFRGIQFSWNAHGDYGWMRDSLAGKFDFYYMVDAMVTDGILNGAKNSIPDDIMTKLQTWYVQHLHDKVTDAGETNSSIAGWKEVMEHVDMKSIRKHGRQFDLIDAGAFDLALTKYIELPHQDIEDSNFFVIYLKPDNLYPIEDRRISCMKHDEFKFIPQAPVATTAQGTFGQGFGTSDMNRFSAAITTGFENAQSSKNIDMQRYDPTTQKGMPL